MLLLNNKLKENDDDLASVKIYDSIVGTASGGTMLTVFNSLEKRIKYKSECGYDPLINNLEKSD